MSAGLPSGLQVAALASVATPRPTVSERHRSHAKSDRRSGRMVCFPIRYADDFIVLVNGTRQQAEAEKAALAERLRKTLRRELSAEKTRITPMTQSVDFLGHRVR